MFKNMVLKFVIPASLLLGGCAAYGHVYTHVPPPAFRVEVRGEAPGPDYVWIDGYYYWQNDVYVWVPGRWTLRPFHGAIWYRPEWQHHGHHGYRFHPGRWGHRR